MNNQQDMHRDQGNAKLLGRREFLNLSAIAVGWIALTTNVAEGVWAAKEAAAAPMLPEGIKHMSAHEFQIMNQLVAAMLPTEGTSFPDTEKVPVMQVLDSTLLGGMEPHVLAGLKAGMKFFDAGPQSDFQNKHFTELSIGEARRFCDNWADEATPAQRGLVMGLKKLIGLAYWSNPSTWPALGYSGPYSREAGIEPRGNAPMPT